MEEEDFELGNHLIDAARWGDLKEVKRLIEEEGIDPNSCDQDGTTPLLAAAEQGHVHIVKCLRDQQVNMEAKNQNGMNALMLAIISGQLDILKELKEYDVNMHVNTADGQTMLELACIHGHLPIVQYLVEMSVSLGMSSSTSINSEDSDDQSSKGIDIDNHSKQYKEYGRSLLQAVLHKHILIVKYLYEQHADLDITTDQDGNNALHCATCVNSLEIVKYLVEDCLMSPVTMNDHGRQPIDLTIDNEIKIYLQRKLDSIHYRTSTKRRLRE